MKTNISASKTGKDSQLVIVSPQKTTQVSFPITSTLGTVSGKLSVIDDFGRSKSVIDHIVVLIDENDTEAAYTTVDKFGNFIMSGIEPGSYTVKLDDSFINEKSLSWMNTSAEKKKTNSTEGAKVDIPFSFRKFVDVKNVNLIYKSW